MYKELLQVSVRQVSETEKKHKGPSSRIASPAQKAKIWTKKKTIFAKDVCSQ